MANDSDVEAGGDAMFAVPDALIHGAHRTEENVLRVLLYLYWHDQRHDSFFQPATPTVIAETMGMSVERVKRALRTLVRSGWALNLGEDRYSLAPSVQEGDPPSAH